MLAEYLAASEHQTAFVLLVSAVQFAAVVLVEFGYPEHSRHWQVLHPL